MKLVRLAVANVNTTVGAVRSNVDRVVELARKAVAQEADLVAFPEQVIGGYSPEDLVQWRGFIEAQWEGLLRLAALTSDLPLALVVGVSVAHEEFLYNTAVFLRQGVLWGLVPKEKLPGYHVFYEPRMWTPGRPGLLTRVRGVPCGDLLFEGDFGLLALELCEDIWSSEGPLRRRCYEGAEIVVNLSASPYRIGIADARRELLAVRSRDYYTTIVYTNGVGANDGLILDGGGYVCQNGRVVLEVPRFQEGVHSVTVDLESSRRLRHQNTVWRLDREQARLRDASLLPHRIQVKEIEGMQSGRKHAYPFPSHRHFFLPPWISEKRKDARQEFCEELLDALTLGLGDYFEKNSSFRQIGVALSGGRDSLFCLILVRRYIDKRYASWSQKERDKKAQEIVKAFFMPSTYSGEVSKLVAITASEELRIPLVVLPIDQARQLELQAVQRMLQPEEQLPSFVSQNIQARIRAMRMWNWANAVGGLFIQTSNMSEKAVGYTTIGGDMEGSLSLIANIPKTLVNYLLIYLQETSSLVCIQQVLSIPPSAELDIGQEDEKDLMPFSILDACLALYGREKMSASEVVQVLEEMFPEHTQETLTGWINQFISLFTGSIYKWVQAPLSLHVNDFDLDRERTLQLPVVQKKEWKTSEGYEQGMGVRWL
ncbi:NAD(+) synthase [Pajaroellobacter abortibovis]|uniref:Glutamine-dependent NAD(+) synthetase n=1 Tax=Pajaroellobacter abortibovis TaxID=1882918 RepID=A0A1L6MV25_9BACT|nr:NAD(+) synthase [Pajaroellobacter abortibovis]APR99372.1 NAD(+) synthase [Pajaroellobacter abortibovis]